MAVKLENRFKLTIPDYLKRIDIVTDIETLGTSTDSQIIQLSAIAFDIETGDILSEFDLPIDISKELEMKVSGGTLEWWLNTDKDLLLDIIKRGKDRGKDLKEAIHELYFWINTMKNAVGDKNVYFWGNGIKFDNVMISTQMELYGLNYPIFYRNDRDMRTITELACTKLNITQSRFKDQFKDDSLVAHDGLDDCKWELKVISYCWNLLKK